MKKFLLAFITLCSLHIVAVAQELNCTVTINSPKNQNIDPQIFKNMETYIREFMNGRKWTNDTYKDVERIKCNLIINITEMPTEGEYKATAIIQSLRPIFNSNITTMLLNLQDKTFDFVYADMQNLDYNDNGYTSQLTSLLAYYAYIILAYDYESFAKDGGTPYLLRAQQLCNNVPANEKSKYKGWNQFDGGVSFTTGTINRYVLVDNWLNPRYKDFRTAFYAYHLNGLDRMYNDAAQGRGVITSSLTMLQKINADNPSLTPLRNFFFSKNSELINIYSKCDMAERAVVITLLSTLDPTNGDKYKQIGKN
ncbi:MAG: DUF4835 family protein [Chitinophagales bacterium]|nr:DUF4835 family protein [Chitinophagales bacterium]HMV15027.1 DUF4835 family protein [Chitinophagales bacterium]HMW12632.1 DUF4835 family protein [Chitinophagales bacterium]HMX59100.1 DUF4835 family protein [Chitinophagales bacterium]HMY24108.1 DUF4835 family protein [Chitinophagales bacterium]